MDNQHPPQQQPEQLRASINLLKDFLKNQEADSRCLPDDLKDLLSLMQRKSEVISAENRPSFREDSMNFNELSSLHNNTVDSKTTTFLMKRARGGKELVETDLGSH